MKQEIDKDTKVVWMAGGLGNQMFQYAFGLELAKKTGCNVLYDKFFYKTHAYEFHRQFHLNIFDLKIPTCSISETKSFSKPSKIFYEKTLFHFDDEVFKSEKKFLVGYWQNEKYFYNVAKTIKQTFKLPFLDDDFNKKTLLKIKQYPNSVAIHVRRGDYIFIKDYVLSTEYYRRAAQYIASKVPNPKFFVFTNEPGSDFRKTFDLGFDYELIDNVNEKNDEDWKDLCLMSACKHKIIANSTFSWWAAWLSDFNDDGSLRTGQIVCAPSPWLYGSSEIIPNRWHKIKWSVDYREHFDFLLSKSLLMKRQLIAIKNSKSYKIGKFITYPLKKIRNVFRKKETKIS